MYPCFSGPRWFPGSINYRWEHHICFWQCVFTYWPFTSKSRVKIIVMVFLMFPCFLVVQNSFFAVIYCLMLRTVIYRVWISIWIHCCSKYYGGRQGNCTAYTEYIYRDAWIKTRCMYRNELQIQSHDGNAPGFLRRGRQWWVRAEAVVLLCRVERLI